MSLSARFFSHADLGERARAGEEMAIARTKVRAIDRAMSLFTQGLSIGGRDSPHTTLWAACRFRSNREKKNFYQSHKFRFSIFDFDKKNERGKEMLNGKTMGADGSKTIVIGQERRQKTTFMTRWHERRRRQPVVVVVVVVFVIHP